MRDKSLGDAYDSEVSLTHATNHLSNCNCSACAAAGNERAYAQALEQQAEKNAQLTIKQDEQIPAFESADALMDRAIENTIVRALFNQDDNSRRRFIRAMGGGTLAAALSSVLPMGAIKAAAKEQGGPLEKKNLKVGFVPITCATPIILANPLGFY